MPNAAMTQELVRLFAIDREARGRPWIQRFYAAIPDAAMRTTQDQVIQGHDGFPYFVLNLPKDGQAFSPISLNDVLEHCLDNGLGVVVHPMLDAPDWVFPFGHLWSLRRFGAFQVERPPSAGGETVTEFPHGTFARETLSEGQEVIVGQPNESCLPAFARKAIREFMRGHLGVKDPRVLLLVDAKSEPSESLIFSVHPEDYPSEKDFGLVLYSLSWFLPPHYALAAVPRRSSLCRNFAAL